MAATGMVLWRSFLGWYSIRRQMLSKYMAIRNSFPILSIPPNPT